MADQPLTTMLNDLGRQGWELVSESVYDTMVGPKHGVGAVGTPLRVVWTFKRAK